MALYIQTNVASLNAQANLAKTQSALQTSFARLSSGYRINSSADDAAGLSISDSMTAQVRSYVVAERNANDGISMAQTADGAAGQMTSILQRMRELAVQARNGSLQPADRANLDTEYQSVLSEIDRIAQTTKFNGTDLLNAPSTVQIQVGIGTTASDQVAIGFGGVTAALLTVAGTDVTDQTKAGAAMDAIDAGLSTLGTKRASWGAAINRFQSTIQNIDSIKNNLSAANSRIRDVDVAEETAAMAKQQVLSQAGAAVLAQANQSPQLALSLLKG